MASAEFVNSKWKSHCAFLKARYINPFSLFRLYPYEYVLATFISIPRRFSQDDYDRATRVNSIGRTVLNTVSDFNCRNSTKSSTCCCCSFDKVRTFWAIIYSIPIALVTSLSSSPITSSLNPTAPVTQKPTER